MKKIIGLVVLAASISTSAMAYDVNGGQFGGGQFGDHGFGPPGPGAGPAPAPSRGFFAAPEIDPASALSAMTMLGAGVMILRGRRSSK